MKLLAALISLALLGAGCAGSEVNQSTDQAAEATSSEPTTGESERSETTGQEVDEVAAWEPIEISMTLYLVDQTGDAGGDFGTSRTEDDLAVIAENMATIWAQAGVVFEPLLIRRVSVPVDVVQPIALGLDSGPFFDQAGVSFEVPDAGVINGFYLRQAAGVNGFAPTGSRVFFVVDEPTVNDERVSSHEVGHLFGLHHVLDDDERLLFSGTNGTILNEQEQQVARYVAQGILDGQR